MSFSFGFSKKKETKKLQSSAIKDEEATADQQQATFVESFDGKRLNKDENKKLVIPLIQNNRWQNPLKPEDLDKDDEVKKEKVKLVEGNTVESQAANEILRAAAGEEDSDEDKNPRTVPLLLANKVPDGFETDDRLNVDLRPESSVDADYEQVPIAEYGQALLRGMGWKEGMGIGKRGRLSKPVEAVLRPKGLGLGADRNVNNQSTNGEAGKNKDEDLSFKKGVHCCINKGKHENMYGVVEGIDEDNARVVVKLAISREMITISQYAVNLVSVKDFQKNSKVLNKGKVDKYKEDEERKKNGRSKDDRESRDKDQDRDRHRDRHRDRRDDRPDKYREEYRDSHKSKDKKRKHEESASDSKKSKSSSAEKMWLRPHLRVRVVDPEYKKGKYFKTKVIIEDVVGPGECVCRTDEGKVLENVHISMLETVIPKNQPSYIMVVSGKHMGKLGEILKRDRAANEALVQMLHDRDQVLQLSFDDVCDYTGNIENEFDY